MSAVLLGARARSRLDQGTEFQALRDAAMRSRFLHQAIPRERESMYSLACELEATDMAIVGRMERCRHQASLSLRAWRRSW